MNPHPTQSTATVTGHVDNQDRRTEVLAHHPTIGGRVGPAQAVHARPHLTLASTPVWKHKLILTGSLDRRTVVELEDEIECLCEEGVTTLVLDLRQLDAIDSVGARTIAFHGAAYRRRGRALTVVPGSPGVYRALVEAGAENLLAGDLGDADVLGVPAMDASRDTSTMMIKSV